MAKKKQYSEEIQRLLKTVVDECDKEDRSVRERQIRTWRRLKLFWEGFQQVWYSETAHDWRVWDIEQAQDNDQAYYDKPVNVFRAYLESIIAALSVTIPPIKCYPDDADNVLDLSTAKAGDKIAQLVSRHNEVSMLWLHSLFIYCIEGMVACYSYPKESEEYGTYQDKKYEDVEEEHHITSCSKCGNVIDSQEVTPDNQGMLNDQLQQFQSNQQQPPNAQPNTLLPNQPQQQPNAQQQSEQNNEELENQERNEFMPDDEDAQLQYALNQGSDLCPSCVQMMDPEIRREKFVVTRLVGITDKPKSRICMEAYGGLYVKVPVYAKNQKECPYLIFSDEINYTAAMEEYDHLDNIDLNKQIVSRSVNGYDLYDSWGRLSPQYRGEYPINVVTKKRAWLRPCTFNFLKNKEDVKKLKKLFPNGARVVYINEEFAEACNEALDDCWTITYNPLSDFIHFDPLGMLLTSIQEITNDLISLTTQTIEHGIGQTIVDPAFLDLKAYAQTEATPGSLIPSKAISGNKSLKDGFFEFKTATLSQEVMPFATSIQQYGQLVSGATPSIFGGQLEGSNTASEYSMSRSNALQRLQNTWKVFTVWWKMIYGKVIPMYIKEMKDDEHDVQRNTDGDFINVFIRRAELEGKIGKIELEANENLPLTWNQVKDVIMNLMNGNNPEFLQMMQSPENLPLLYQAIGLTDFYVPGEDDREKQYDEIKLLLNSTPIETGDPNMPEAPSIEIDPVYDNHQIEFEIVRKWAVSEAGRQAKTDNQMGYTNVLLHGKMHYDQMQQAMMQQQMQQMQQQGKGANPAKQPKQPSLKNAPIQGDHNVATVQ